MNHELRPEELELNELMWAYRVTTDNLEDACENLDAEIRRLQEAKSIIAEPYQKTLETLEMKMRLPMLDRQSTFTCSFGKINFRKGAVRRIWNLDALDQVCAAKPEVKENIWAFRSEVMGEPSITVKLNEVT